MYRWQNFSILTSRNVTEHISNENEIIKRINWIQDAFNTIQQKQTLSEVEDIGIISKIRSMLLT